MSNTVPFPFPRRLLALTAVLWLASLLSGHAETITGTFKYQDFNPANGTSRLEPIRFCRVEVWGFRPRVGIIWGWGKDADSVTDANGRISVPLSFQVPGVIYGVRITAENYAAVVWPNVLAPTAQFYNEPGEPDGVKFERVANTPNDVLDFSYNFTDAWTPQHWSMAEAIRHGFDFVTARRDPNETDFIPKAGVQPGYWPTFYDSFTVTLSINSLDVFEDYTMLHEYAHFLEHHIGAFAPVPSIHDGCTQTDLLGGHIEGPELAWMEGFAEFFAMAAATSLPAGTLQGFPGGNGTFTLSELENTPWNCSGTGLPASVTPAAIENVVAGILWDLADGIGACNTSEAHDNLSGFTTTIIQIMDREMDLPYWPSIFDFQNAWVGRGLPFPPLFDIMIKHGIYPPVPVTLVCPGDVTATAAPNECLTSVTYPQPTIVPARRCATVQCDWQSGASFSTGTTTVSCEAREAGAVIATCSFHVTVNANSNDVHPNGTGLLGVYYDEVNFSTARAARVEPVNFDWRLGSPAPGVDPESFSVRWSGQVVPPYSGVWFFWTTSDDGVRLRVNNQLLIDNWTDHASTVDHNFIFLQGGQPYDVVMEMYENTGSAVAKLEWSQFCRPREVIPATHLFPSRLECPDQYQRTFPRDLIPRLPTFILFGDAVWDGDWLKLTRADNSYGIAYVGDFRANEPVFGFEASFKAALFGSLCCGNGLFPADGFSFNLVPPATLRHNPGYGEPAEEGLNEGLAINFDTWDNGNGEAPAIECKWLGQVVARVPFQPSQSPAGITIAEAAAREVIIKMTSDGKLTLSYGGVLIFNNIQTPYSANIIGRPAKWVLGARNGGANDNHWIRDLKIVANPPNISRLFNTGVDDNGRPLADNTPDPHYQLVPGSAIVGTPVVATSAGGFPIGPWLPDNSEAAWIAPSVSTDGPENAYYGYQTTFDLNGLDPMDSMIQGWVAADNGLAGILINGNTTGFPSDAGFTYWRAFTVGQDKIQPGLNTLTFVVYNAVGGDNPTGLRVQMCGWASTTPQLKLDIDHTRLRTTLTWGSLPNKTYFIEHTVSAAGSWVRQPLSFFPGSYRAGYTDGHRTFYDPTRLYRVIEAP